jgi:hypothetical protein
MVVREIGSHDLILDLDSVTINGRRYGIAAESDVTANRRSGVGVNKRTGKYVGGGAILGAIIGGITGGGKGAAIGAGAGAAAGAGAQILTRGDSIDVPAESLLVFRLVQPIRTPVLDSGFYRDGRHYHSGYGNDRASVAYQQGLREGRSDADRNRAANPRSRWNSVAQRRDYEAGYNRGYYGAAYNRGYYDDQYYQSADRRYKPSVGGSISIGRDNNIRWQGPPNSRVYVQSDNNPRQLFAAGDSGTQLAPWIQNGHVYVFTLVDNDGRELARDQLDLRGRRR